MSPVIRRNTTLPNEGPWSMAKVVQNTRKELHTQCSKTQTNLSRQQRQEIFIFLL